MQPETKNSAVLRLEMLWGVPKVFPLQLTALFFSETAYKQHYVI